MLPGPPSPRNGGRSAAPAAAVVLWLVASAAGACAPAPPVAAFPPPPAGDSFAYRDPRDGAPPPPLASRDAKILDAALAALRRGDAAGAEKALAARKRKSKGEPGPLKLVEAYAAIAKGERDGPRALLAALTADSPTWIAAVEAEADLALAEGRAPDALERYRTLHRLTPSDRRSAARIERLRTEVAAAKRVEAEAALASGDLDAVRRAAHSLIQLEPESPAGYLFLSRAASAGKKNEDAWAWAQEARRKAPGDPAVSAFAAEAASRAGRWADAAVLYEGLAATDPSFVPKAEEARAEFRVQNLPEAARHAANSPRLTRAQLASLLWWTVPEFRDALVPPGAEIAVDVVDRPDRGTLVRAIGLGFLAVSAETHRVGAESAVGRDEMAAALRRVAVLTGRGRTPKGCLAPEAPTAAALTTCGILSDTPPRNVTGRDALRALEKAARLGREGGTR